MPRREPDPSWFLSLSLPFTLALLSATGSPGSLVLPKNEEKRERKREKRAAVHVCTITSPEQYGLCGGSSFPKLHARPALYALRAGGRGSRPWPLISVRSTARAVIIKHQCSSFPCFVGGRVGRNRVGPRCTAVVVVLHIRYENLSSVVFDPTLRVALPAREERACCGVATTGGWSSPV